MAYATTQDVADLTPWLLASEENFTKTTSPTEAAVQRWLDRGAGVIDARLAAKGYDIPVGSSATVYDQIIDLNAMYAAAKAESTRMTSRVAVTERTRSQMFQSDFKKQLDGLLAMDLSQAGVGHTSQIKVTGISESDKKAIDDDTDRVSSRFKRGQFNISGATRPSGSDN